MMINNAGDVLKLCSKLAQKKNKSFTACNASAIDILVIFHINNTLNDS